MSNCKSSCEKPKDKEGLCACLVLDVILDGIRNEVLHLEEYLHSGPFDLSDPPHVLWPVSVYCSESFKIFIDLLISSEEISTLGNMGSCIMDAK